MTIIFYQRIRKMEIFKRLYLEIMFSRKIQHSCRTIDEMQFMCSQNRAYTFCNNMLHIIVNIHMKYTLSVKRNLSLLQSVTH